MTLASLCADIITAVMLAGAADLMIELWTAPR